VAALQSWLRARLPDFMVPSDFVFLDHLPLTRNGKVDRAALPAPAPSVPVAAAREADSFAGELLTELWAELLGRERVDPADDFFALGGHSLLATQLMSRVRRAFGVEVPLRALFEAPTPAQLARRIAEIARSEDHRQAPPLRPIPRPTPGEAEAALPLSFAQQRLWFLYQLDPSSPSYNVPRAVRLAGVLQPPALAAALGEVVRRHEVLRTSFPVVAGQPAQMIAPPRSLLLPCVDLSGLPEGPLNSRLDEIGGHLDITYFCWIGGTGDDSPFYYRIQSPVIFIEFDHHAGVFLTNAEPAKFHAHVIVRTPNGNDYGFDLLRQHRESAAAQRD